MIPNLHSLYLATETRSRFLLVGLFLLSVVSLLGIVFVSPALVIGILLGAVTILFTFYRPTWALGFLSLYLPFEPFLLKWVPNDLYVFARYGSELLVYLLVAATLAHILFGEAKLRRTPADLPFILFLVSLAASVVINFVPPFQAILGIRQILRFVLLFFITIFLAPSKRWVRTVLIGLSAIIALQVVLGAGQALIGEKLDTFLLPGERRTLGEIQLTSGTVQFWDPGQRVFGTMGRYDQLGTFLAFFLLIGIAFVYEKAIPKKYFLPIGALLFAVLPVLALTYSRSSWFGFVLGFLFIGIYMMRDKRVVMAAVIVPCLAFLYLSVTGLVVHELIDTPKQSFAQRLFEAFSYERFVGEYYGLGRTYWIVQTVTKVVPYSPIFGVGPARYGAGAVAALHDASVYDALALPFGVYGTEGYIDNNWFSLWGESGTLGLLAYLWFYGAIFLAVVHVARTSKDRETRALALGVGGAMLAVVVNAFLATFLETRTLAPYLWIFSGLVISLGQKEEIL
jgi:hypothetical protein